MVVRVDRLRIHAPLELVDRFVMAITLATELRIRRALDVAVKVVCFDFERGIVTPLVRVADHGLELRQLVERFRLGGLGHPVELGDALLVCLYEVADELEHALLGFGWEVLLHVHLANDLTDQAIDEARCTAPVFALLLNTGERLLVELEVLLVDRLREAARRVVQGAPRQVGLPGIKVGIDDNAVERLEVVDREDADERHFADFELGKVAVPVEVRHQLGEVFIANLAVVLEVATRLLLGHVLGREPGFERHDGVGSGRAVRQAGQLVHLGDVRYVLLTNLLGLFVILQVVLTVGEPEPALARHHRIAFRVLRVGQLADTERCVERALRRLGEIDGQVIVVRDRGYALELGLQRLDTARIACFPVEERFVQVTDLLFIRAFREVAACRLLDDGLDGFLRFVAQLVEDAVARLVCRHLGVFDPGAVDVGEKVVAGTDARVHRREVYAANGRRWRLLGRLLLRFLAARCDKEQRCCADQ